MSKAFLDQFGPPPEGAAFSAFRPDRLEMSFQNVDVHGEISPSMTRQEFTDECDINQIMARYDKTGMLPVNAPTPAQFVDWSAMPADLQEAMHMMIDADQAFMRLPASVRKEFDNDAVRFVEFAQNSDNLDRMREFGLAPPAEAPPAPMRVEVVNPSPPPEKPPEKAP